MFRYFTVAGLVKDALYDPRDEMLLDSGIWVKG